jgi:hypothetical protein
MSRLIFIHGIAQQYKGPESLRAACAPALCDGVRLAEGVLDPADVTVAFYGDLFRPAGARSTEFPAYDVSDVQDPFERELLLAWWFTAAELDTNVLGLDAPTRGRTPQLVQRALYALSGSKFFGGLTERAMVGSLKQVRRYFTDETLRHHVRQRLLDAITAQTSVIVAHSLGSVVAYETLCAAQPNQVTTLITLGSPLGLPNLIFDRLIPAPVAGFGAWPGRVRQWTNIADRGDIVANPQSLAPLFGNGVADIAVHNGIRAHDVRPYLTARETGSVVLAGLAPDCR